MFHHVINPRYVGRRSDLRVLGTKLPGPGTIYLAQDLRFRHPVGIGDTITATLTVKEKRPEKGNVTLDCVCANQDGVVVITGTAETRAPREKTANQARKSALCARWPARRDARVADSRRCWAGYSDSSGPPGRFVVFASGARCRDSWVDRAHTDWASSAHSRGGGGRGRRHFNAPSVGHAGRASLCRPGSGAGPGRKRSAW